MARLLFLLLLLVACTAHAACFDLTTYQNSKLFLSISDGGCATSVKITYAPVKNGKVLFDLSKELEFDDECKLSDDYKFLTCRVNKRNPLSGTTYKQIQKGKLSCDNVGHDAQDPAYVYRCIKGCQGAPRELPMNEGCD